MSKILIVNSLICALLLSACSLQLSAPVRPELKLLPPAEVSDEILVKQRVVLEAGGSRDELLLVARFEKKRVKLVLLSAAGLQLLALDYDGNSLSQEISHSVDIPSQDLLAVIQFAIWPVESIEKHYTEAAGWQLRLEPGKRILLTAGDPILKIIYGPDEMRIDSIIHDYRARVFTLEKTPL